MGQIERYGGPELARGPYFGQPCSIATLPPSLLYHPFFHSIYLPPPPLSLSVSSQTPSLGEPGLGGMIMWKVELAPLQRG